ncbi:MAG: hypothetical protein AAF235_01570, partial [Planctomycetota bacterium]
MTTREAPAMASLLLADSVLTLLPTPPSGRSGDEVDLEAARRAVEDTPGYVRFMDSWRWAMPFFVEGVVQSSIDGEDIADDVRAAWSRIRCDDGLAVLRPLMHDDWFDDDRTYLAALTRDVVRGGPDPSVSIPVAAGVDSFAARHGVPVARPAPASVVQKIEARRWERGASVVVPVLVQGSADRVLEAREMFEAELDELRAALDHTLDSFAADDGIGVGAVEGVRKAAAAYTDAFER